MSSSNNTFGPLASSSESDEVQVVPLSLTKKKKLKQRHRTTNDTAAAAVVTKVLRQDEVFAYDGNAGTLDVVETMPVLSEYALESVRDVFSRLSRKGRKAFKKDDPGFAKMALGVLQKCMSYSKTASQAVELIYSIFRRQFINFKPRSPTVRIISLNGTNKEVLRKIVGKKGKYMTDIGEEHNCHVFFGNSKNITTCPELLVFSLSHSSNMIGCYMALQDHITEVVSDYEEDHGQLEFTMKVNQKTVKEQRFRYPKGSKQYKEKLRRTGGKSRY